MITYAFVDNGMLDKSRIIFQDSENDPPTRWHDFDEVKTVNALLLVESLNENEKKQHSQ